MSESIRSSGIGEPVRRKEDLRLITGKGCFSDDVNVPGQAFAVMVRSPHAHARIRSIDSKKASRNAGVLAILTGQDMLGDNLQPLPHRAFSFHPAEIRLTNKDGTPPFTAPHYPLTPDKARHVGEPVAMVIAETVAAAKDAAELIEVEYEVLPAVTYTVAAAKPDAPRVYDEAKSNVCVDAEVGDRNATEAAFARAAHVVKLETWVQRVTGVTLEPRAAAGIYDASTDRYTIHTGSGGAVRLKDEIAAILNVPSAKVRVVMRDIGGNFGTRGFVYPEFALVAWAARRVGRPVKWTCERSESFLSDSQGRDLAVEAELALDANGRFLAMRGSNIGNAGAYTGSFLPLQKGVEIMSTIYRMPAACFRARAVVSNTPMTRPYRSAGRPEVMFVMERLIDLAARQCGFDRIELRRLNLISAAELPYKNPFGMTYDNGEYHDSMEQALKLGDWSGFPARRAEARARGKCRGIGIANYLDTATGVPRERAEITVRPEGRVDVVIGTMSQGQGHETSFAQLVTEWLGVPFEQVQIITGDTDIVKVGGGAHSGRAMRLASIVIWNSSQEIIKKGARLAALLLDCEPSEIQFKAGRFILDGTDRSVGLFDVARAPNQLKNLPEDLRGPLAAFSDETVSAASFPYGCHVCEVEVDPELGTLQIVRYVAVDDVGRAVNPLIIEGQIHGAIVQGSGQALFEQCFYDSSTGQLLSGSLMDYAMPRADCFPSFETRITEVPATSHPHGIRAAGEGGTTPTLAVIANAVVDALAHYGVKHIELPVTPERVWRAIHGMEFFSPSAPKNR